MVKNKCYHALFITYMVVACLHLTFIKNEEKTSIVEEQKEQHEEEMGSWIDRIETQGKTAEKKLELIEELLENAKKVSEGNEKTLENLLEEARNQNKAAKETLKQAQELLKGATSTIENKSTMMLNEEA